MSDGGGDSGGDHSDIRQRFSAASRRFSADVAGGGGADGGGSGGGSVSGDGAAVAPEEPLEVRFGKAAQLFETKVSAGEGEGEEATSTFASAAKMWGQR